MGVAGTLEYLSEVLSSVKKHKKKKQITTVAVKIRMDCEGCARKVKNALSRVKGTAIFKRISLSTSSHLSTYFILYERNAEKRIIFTNMLC